MLFFQVHKCQDAKNGILNKHISSQDERYEPY